MIVSPRLHVTGIGIPEHTVTSGLVFKYWMSSIYSVGFWEKAFKFIDKALSVQKFHVSGYMSLLSCNSQLELTKIIMANILLTIVQVLLMQMIAEGKG